jgi:hypothetical protein
MRATAATYILGAMLHPGIFMQFRLRQHGTFLLLLIIFAPLGKNNQHWAFVYQKEAHS